MVSRMIVLFALTALAEALVLQNQEEEDLSISLALLHHPFEAHPVSQKVPTMLKALAAGDQGVTFRRVTVFYDGHQPGPELDKFLNELDEMKKSGVIHNHVALRFKDPAINRAYNGTLVPAADPERYNWQAGGVAFYQNMFEECTTVLCLTLEGDIWAHYGGGIRTTAKLLLNNPEYVAMVPPRIGEIHFSEDLATMSDLKPWDDGTPFTLKAMHVPDLALGRSNAALDGCRVSGSNGMSTRYFLAHRPRVLDRKLFPLTLPAGNGLLEQALTAGSVSCPRDSHVGWVIHSPMFGKGVRLQHACSVAGFQQLVDNPEGLRVDSGNSMIEESWGDACIKIGEGKA